MHEVWDQFGPPPFVSLALQTPGWKPKKKAPSEVIVPGPGLAAYLAPFPQG